MSGMRGRTGSVAAAVCALMLILSACSDDAGDTSSSSIVPTTTGTTAPSTTAAPTTTNADAPSTTAPPPATTTTEPQIAGNLPRVTEGDRGDLVEELQSLLVCRGSEVAIDGAFGPGTLAAVEEAQNDLGLEVDGIVGPSTFTALLQSCEEIRRIDGDGERNLVAYSTPTTESAFSLALFEGSTVTVTLPDIDGLVARLTRVDGVPAVQSGPDSFLVESTQEHVFTIDSPQGPAGFTFTLNITPPDRPLGDWVLATDGITYNTEPETTLALGDDAATTIDRIFEFLGHGVRGSLDEFDTGWYPITEPQPIGLRGISIEGLAFLFFGPDPSDPDRPETLARIRFLGPTVDANGDDRPANYVTTAEGITVGDTLAELEAAYGGDVRAGSNADEYYYRFTDSGGELCFYFGPDEPDALTAIVQIATECRD